MLNKKMFHDLKEGHADTVSTTILSRIIVLFLSFFILVAATPGILEAQEAAQEDDWQFGVEPFLWIASINGTTASGTDLAGSGGDWLQVQQS